MQNTGFFHKKRSPYLNSPGVKVQRFFREHFLRMGTERRENQNDRARLGDQRFFRSEQRYPNAADRLRQYCDFTCFYVVFSLLFLNYIIFQLYSHGADN